jgi:hypothetical protein
LHFLNKKQERELLQRLAEKYARSPEKEPQKAIFIPAERQNERGNEGFEREKQRKFRK